MNFSRVLHPDDYNLFNEWKEVDALLPRLNKTYRYEHKHRHWEYGLALKFLREVDPRYVLDVGGGGSVMSPLLAINNFEVTQSDIAHGERETSVQNELLGTEMQFVTADFSWSGLSIGHYDVVISMSVIEHVKYHKTFFANLLKHADKAVLISTDFHPSGEAFSIAHRRTYNKESLQEYIDIAKNYGFVPPQEPEYEYKGNHVYDYTFATLALIKDE